MKDRWRPADEIVGAIDRALDPAFPLIKEWASAAINDCMLLPPSANRGEILLAMQVTTRSVMGAIAYETGGVLIDLKRLY
jgi:Protein of unknown function DUF2625